jgi:hypothetical protein
MLNHTSGLSKLKSGRRASRLDAAQAAAAAAAAMASMSNAGTSGFSGWSPVAPPPMGGSLAGIVKAVLFRSLERTDKSPASAITYKKY